MNDEFKMRLLKYLDGLEEVGHKGAEFVSEQAPETVRQILEWTFWSSIMGFLFGVVVVIVSVAALKYSICRTERAKASGGDEVGWFIGCCAAASCIIGFSIVAFHDAGTAVKCKIAPNVVLIEKAAALAKSAK